MSCPGRLSRYNQVKSSQVKRLFIYQISQVAFASLSYLEWIAQFKALEDDESFRSAFATAQSSASRPARTGAAASGDTNAPATRIQLFGTSSA